MTTPEHTMVGILGAFALGLHNRFSWPVVAFAALASNVPDLDGLPMLFDMERFEFGHRVWGHNFFAIVVTSILLAWTQVRFNWVQRLGCYVARFLPSEVVITEQRADSPIPMSVFILVGIGFQSVHLVCDMVVSGGQGLSDWFVKPFWPFGKTGFVYPLIPWGDVGPTVIMMGGLIGIAKYGRAQFISVLTLIVLISYLFCRSYWA